MMTSLQKPQLGAKFLDLQAAAGITKHIGGYEATDELLGMGCIEQAQDVLNIGCGIGVASVHIARKYGCHVVGVDISEKMIEWSRRRAREAHVEDKAEFRVADALDLPFEANSFDLVFCESVLIFVEDKAEAIRECTRVTRPGGYVAMNEAFSLKPMTPELEAQVRNAIGPSVTSLEGWQALWEGSGLQERQLHTHPVDPRKEIRDRIRWIGWKWLVQAWMRLVPMYIKNPAIRQSIKDQFDTSADLVDYIGYGIFVGRK
jgi:arsenite methyltransferase